MKRILLVGTCASGTTALAKCFLQRSDTFVLSQVLKTFAENGEPVNLDVFYRNEYPYPVLFNKETLGHRNLSLCEFPLFEDGHLQDPENYFLFIFRHPVDVWHSWRKRGWDKDREYLIRAYEHLYRSYGYAHQTGQATAINFSKLGEGIEEHLRGICNFCEIEYQEEMIVWDKKWGNRRGGNTGNPDIDTYPTFSEERILAGGGASLETESDHYINERVGNLWRSACEV